MNKLHLLIFSVILLTSNLSVADEDRYQAVVLQRGGSSDNHGKVFIIDSEMGHMWMWEDKSKFITKEGKIAFGTKITYQGKLKPGKEIGEIIGHGLSH